MILSQFIISQVTRDRSHVATATVSTQLKFVMVTMIVGISVMKGVSVVGRQSINAVVVLGIKNTLNVDVYSLLWILKPIHMLFLLLFGFCLFFP